jgi:hypothetical protein
LVSAAVTAGSAAAAPNHAWVILDETPHSLHLWDQGGAERHGDDVDLYELLIWTPYNQPRQGLLTLIRASCEWGTIQWVHQTELDDAGHVASDKDLPGRSPSFYGPHGWLAASIADACDSPGSAPQTSFPNLAAVFGYARKLTPYPPPSNGPMMVHMPAPRGPLDPAYAGPYRFSPIVEDAALGHVAFLDWASLQRTGNVVTARTLIALADDSPPPPAPQWATMNVIVIRRFDCKAGSVVTVGEAEFRKDLTLFTQDSTAWPVRSTAHWRVGARLLEAACRGAEPPSAFTSLLDAVTYQRRLHPLR